MNEAPPNEKLRALADLLGVEETRELVQLFLRTAPGQLADLTHADRTECRRAAHSLKSSCHQMGQPALAERARQIEQRMDAGGPSPSPPELAAIADEFQRTCAALREFAGT